MDLLTYRQANREDLVNIVAIYNSTVPTRMSTADTEPIAVESREKWYEEHQGNRPLWMVENQKQEVLGWVSFQSFYGRPAYDATAELSIYIDSRYRGKGVGKQILEYCIRTAPGLKIKTLLGFIFAHNEPSLKLFHHFGFEEWGSLPNIAVLDGKERGVKIVGKRIVP